MITIATKHKITTTSKHYGQLQKIARTRAIKKASKNLAALCRDYKCMKATTRKARTPRLQQKHAGAQAETRKRTHNGRKHAGAQAETRERATRKNEGSTQAPREK